MNELLQKHGCSNVFSIPEGLKELMSDITREVLREQPPKLYDFIANYLSVLLITREHGIMAVKILDDLCDCRPSVSEHLLQLGLERNQAVAMSEIIKSGIEEAELEDDTEIVRESQILKKILIRNPLDEDVTAKVCQIIRNAYRDYWYRKKLLQKSLKVDPEEPWEIAAQHTLELYKKTKPSLSDLSRATERIQSAYRGYHVRKNLLRHIKPKPKLRPGPDVELPGPPLDIAGSREIDLGPVVTIKVKEDNVSAMFDAESNKKLGLKYDPMKTITHLEEDSYLNEVHPAASTISSQHSHISDVMLKAMPSRHSQFLPRQASQDKSQLMQLSPTLQEEDNLYKMISFAEVPPEIIPDVPDEKEQGEDAIDFPASEPDELGQEEPEDVAEAADHSDGDGQSVPSATSSPPESENITDVEDVDEDLNATEEEEGLQDVDHFI